MQKKILLLSFFITTGFFALAEDGQNQLLNTSSAGGTQNQVSNTESGAGSQNQVLNTNSGRNGQDQVSNTEAAAGDGQKQISNTKSGGDGQNQVSNTESGAGSQKQVLNTEAAASEQKQVLKTDVTDQNQKNLSLTPSLTHKNLNLPGYERKEVEAFRKMYLEPKWSKLLYGYLENAMEYRLYVRQCIEKLGLPEELEYLPVVESNYNPNAKSKSGAIGMWQFMANSVAPFLVLNDYVDERYDPWKSTDAALKKLTDNYNYFHDWELAIAAYNCGVGALSKALKKAPKDQQNYWYLVEHKLLSAQTSSYVPKLIAIADLAENSEYYGIDLPSHKEEYEILQNEKEGNFDYISVKKAYSIQALAREMKMNEKRLLQLNPSYILGFTHPSKESKIRLPLGMKQSALDAIVKITPIDFPVKYTVKKGDSLWSISREYGTTVKAICELNGIQENAILKIGKILYIPSK